MSALGLGCVKTRQPASAGGIFNALPHVALSVRAMQSFLPYNWQTETFRFSISA
jgi:hypothetical protein